MRSDLLIIKKAGGLFMELKENYNALDVAKFVCIILVIVIHTSPFAFNIWLDGGCGLVTRIAVPFFFCSSAYLIFSRLINMTDNQIRIEVYKKYILRLAKLYFIWVLIYLPFNVATNLSDGIIKKNEIMAYLTSVFIYGCGNYLWFIQAMIYAAVILFILKKLLALKTKTIFTIAIFFWIIGLCFSTYQNIFQAFSWWQWINQHVISYIGLQNGLFFGFPYMALGMC